MHTETTTYADMNLELEGYVALDSTVSGKRPAVLVSHAWAGQSDFERSKAEMLAGLGYVGFAIDVYGKGKRGSNPDENAQLMQPFLDDRALLRRRMAAAVHEIKQHDAVDPHRIAAIGFCFGGLCVLDLARATPDVTGVKGVVSFHGLLNEPKITRPAGKITAKVLALHGYDDPLAPPDSVHAFAAEMTKAGADWQMLMFGHQVHAFTNPQANDRAHGMAFDAATDRRAFAAMRTFLAEALA